MMSNKAEEAIKFPNIGMQLKFSGLRDYIKESFNRLAPNKVQVILNVAFLTLI